jgi:uncharacterized membrane protein
MWPLLGIAVVIAGFAARINPLLVIAAAVGVTGWAAGMSPVHMVEAFGKAFNDDRLVSVAFLALPVIGLLERYGLQERARMLIARLRGITAGRLLFVYFLARQISAATGIAFGGQAQMVRPLLAPMVEAAAEKEAGTLSPARRFWLRAHAAAVENVGAFFGEDIFFAIGSILVIKAFLASQHIIVEPFALSVWAIPTAVLAALIHGTRLLLIDRELRRRGSGIRDQNDQAQTDQF